METKTALAAALAGCEILAGGACAGRQENASGTPSDDEPSPSREAARAPGAETTEPSAPGSEKTEMEETGREDRGASGAGQIKDKRDKESRKRGASAGVVVVKIEGLVYEPSEVEVSPGNTVRWVNEDPAEHKVTSEEEGGSLRSDVFGEGGSFQHAFDEPGEPAYLCEVHPFMKGIVVVR